MAEFAFFGPSERHSVPAGGFCISVFAIIRRGRRVLMVKPKLHERWQEEWAPNWRIYSPEQAAWEFDHWRFPSSYVREGESPEETLARLMTEQLGIRGYRARGSELLNFYSPSRRYQGKMHWDYCFVFRVATTETPKDHPWFSAIEYLDPATVSPESLGSSQGELLDALKTPSS